MLSLSKMISRLLGLPTREPGVSLGRARAFDSYMAFRFGVPAGFAGNVNRSHPNSTEPAKNDASLPLTFFGEVALVNGTNNSVRKVQPADTADVKIWGIVTRPYPIQQQSGGMATDFGGGTPPGANQPIDILRLGYILTKVNVVSTQPVKGGAVYVWVAASSGDNIQGQILTADDGTNSALVTNATFNGPADENGIAEIIVSM